MHTDRYWQAVHYEESVQKLNFSEYYLPSLLLIKAQKCSLALLERKNK